MQYIIADDDENLLKLYVNNIDEARDFLAQLRKMVKPEERKE